MSVEDYQKDSCVLAFTPKKTVSKKNESQISPENREKFEIFRSYIEQGLVSVVCDARAPDVLVPDDFKNLADLRLNFSFGFQIPDFDFNENAVWASLSFEAGDFFCRIPWNAIYIIQSAHKNEGAIFHDDAPLIPASPSKESFGQKEKFENPEPAKRDANVIQLKFPCENQDLGDN